MKTEKDKVLERFMKEFFHFPTLRKAGFFTKEMKGDYKAQAERVCQHFGYKTVFEYGAQEIRCHITELGNEGYIQPFSERTEPFITVIGNIYE
jgi:hypothetical protein